MTRVEVRLELAAGPATVGHLLDTGQQVYFEYAPAFLASGLELSPFKLPLGPGVHEALVPEFHGLHGLFFDSLPDGWGLLLMHRRMRERGIDPHRISVLAWLRHLGMRAMGALSYHPAESTGLDQTLEVELAQLATEAVAVFEGKAERVLPELELAGGSPGGARPKVVVALGPGRRVLAGANALPEGFEHWLVKFSARDDLKDACALEEVYARMARAAGLRMPPTQLLPLGGKRRCFALKRFDRIGSTRIHMHTIGGLLHASHRVPSLDYLDLLRAAGALTRSQAEVVEGFRRLCFNVLACNRDDHVRNFSFLMNEEGEWSYSPAYDLTYSEGIRGHHTTTVLGERLAPQATTVLELAEQMSISRLRAMELLEEVSSGIGKFRSFARAVGLAPETSSRVAARLAEVRQEFGEVRATRKKKARKPGPRRRAKR
jgi:serine/threonine-protein kinase HipA